MKLLKSRKGFTLIELLVVIGILAVLAAIAIPSVAGLIDRANVSADKTNANEMTNAMERFASEYELYCQDIASGAVQAGNLDSAQGRVYNVLGGATTRAEITALEVAEGTIVPEGQIAIYRDTKYPANATTARAIVENYTKTSSSTFEPKQSDMHYWYSPDCGIVVFAEPDADVVTDLNSQIQSGKDAKGNALNGDTQWVDLTIAINLNSNTTHSDVIPNGGTYYIGVTGTIVGDYSTATSVLNAGDAFPETPQAGDVYVYGDYEYRYEKDFFYEWKTATIQNGWGVRVINLNKQTYGSVLQNIANCPIKSLRQIFTDCVNLEYLDSNFVIPPQTQSTRGMFWKCEKLKHLPTNFTMPNTITDAQSMFDACSSLEYLPNNFRLSNNLTNATAMFDECYSLKALPSGFTIPASLTNMYWMFPYCTSLKSIPFKIPSTVTNIQSCFASCTSLTGTITIDANPNAYASCFSGINFTKQNLTLAGSSSMLNEIGATGISYNR